MSFTIGPMHQVHNQAQPLSLKSGTSSSVWISNSAAWKTGSASSFSLSLIFTFTAGKVTFYRQSMYASLFTQKIIRVAFCWIILSRDADSLISAVIICFRRTTELQAIIGVRLYSVFPSILWPWEIEVDFPKRAYEIALSRFSAKVCLCAQSSFYRFENNRKRDSAYLSISR